MVKLKLPKHVAIIMDGNGRWAKQRNLPRIAGHQAGMNNLQTIATAASNLGIEALTVYAFSTENWRRPTNEVNFLMRLPIDFFDKFMPDLMKNNVRIMITGFLEQLPAKTLAVCQRAIEQTANNDGMILNFAFNYGAQSDIINAMKLFYQDVESNSRNIADLNEDVFSGYLKSAQLGKLQNPDFLIRTSGEQRLSNFYLWELAYSEMIFVDEYWPDYSVSNLERDLKKYSQRDRRYGGLNEKNK
ncbi:isoprenyl transferase [Bombilactobacillus bombi]|jgi:undecaprenyl diphosphate synthase|uniref:isoprenyl transferase n=1 Tax=Bombilactobacillus bombi TaxID=1303590 RepID=UPI000E58E282|nr:isoprenyl transferase [Bombilactobacillus bombi]AXX64375.1 isoprenyl transferase [Bombilactobacillus bombi]